MLLLKKLNSAKSNKENNKSFLFFTFRMGNPAMPIDRYDVRGLLSDLSKHEAKNVEPNLKYSDYLSPEDTLVINKKNQSFIQVIIDESSVKVNVPSFRKTYFRAYIKDLV
jgi:hypothetical protein